MSTTIGIKVDDLLRERIRNAAQNLNRTPHWLMREAIERSVEREERREAFRQDTLKAWEEYRTTGLHVSADEADAWLDQLEQGRDIEPPACHG